MNTACVALVIGFLACVAGGQNADSSTMSITTYSDQGWLSLQSEDFEVTRRSSLYFKVKSCSHVRVRLFPDGLTTGDIGYHFLLNDHEDGKVLAAGRLCTVQDSGALDCGDKEHVEMESTCDDFKTFWFRFDEEGTVEFGEGCNIGEKAMYNNTAENRFLLGDVKIFSHKEASWVFGNICEWDDNPSPESTTVESTKPISTTAESTMAESTTLKPTTSESTTQSEETNGSTNSAGKEGGDSVGTASSGSTSSGSTNSGSTSSGSTNSGSTNSGSISSGSTSSAGNEEGDSGESDIVGSNNDEENDEDGSTTKEDEASDLSSVLDDFLDNSSSSIGFSMLTLLLVVSANIVKLVM